MTVFPITRAALVACLLLAGCAVGPDFSSPKPPDGDRYTPAPMVSPTVSAPGVEGAAQTLVPGADIPAQWWSLYRSPELDALIKMAIANSPNLASASAALREAQEDLKVARAAFFPNVSGALGDTRERISPITTGLPSSFTEEINVAQAAINASYTVDVFGATRRAVEGAQAQANYYDFQLEAAYLTLTSNIVNAAIKEASLRAQIEATESVIADQSRALDLLNRQFQFGAVPKTTVLSQQSLVAATKATLPGLQKQLAQNRHLLAVLAGRLPSSEGIPEFTLATLNLPTDIPLSMPSELVRQRPDLRASEALLHSASAQIGVATAALYPQLTLTGQFGSEALSASGLFKGPATIWTIGAGLTQPLFNAGELRAKRRAAVDAYDVAQAQYQQAVLTAFENVADSLRALDTDAEALQAIAESESVAHQALELSQSQYKFGAVSFVQLLQVETQYQQARVNLAQAQATRLADTAALFQSMGGGWWNRTEPLADANPTLTKP